MRALLFVALLVVVARGLEITKVDCNRVTVDWSSDSVAVGGIIAIYNSNDVTTETEFDFNGKQIAYQKLTDMQGEGSSTSNNFLLGRLENGDTEIKAVYFAPPNEGKRVQKLSSDPSTRSCTPTTSDIGEVYAYLKGFGGCWFQIAHNRTAPDDDAPSGFKHQLQGFCIIEGGRASPVTLDPLPSFQLLCENAPGSLTVAGCGTTIPLCGISPGNNVCFDTPGRPFNVGDPILFDPSKVDEVSSLNLRIDDLGVNGPQMLKDLVDGKFGLVIVLADDNYPVGPGSHMASAITPTTSSEFYEEGHVILTDASNASPASAELNINFGRTFNDSTFPYLVRFDGSLSPGDEKVTASKCWFKSETDKDFPYGTLHTFETPQIFQSPVDGVGGEFDGNRLFSGMGYVSFKQSKVLGSGTWLKTIPAFPMSMYCTLSNGVTIQGAISRRDDRSGVNSARLGVDNTLALRAIARETNTDYPLRAIAFAEFSPVTCNIDLFQTPQTINMRMHVPIRSVEGSAQGTVEVYALRGNQRESFFKSELDSSSTFVEAQICAPTGFRKLFEAGQVYFEYTQDFTSNGGEAVVARGRFKDMMDNLDTLRFSGKTATAWANMVVDRTKNAAGVSWDLSIVGSTGSGADLNARTQGVSLCLATDIAANKAPTADGCHQVFFDVNGVAGTNNIITLDGRISNALITPPMERDGEENHWDVVVEAFLDPTCTSPVPGFTALTTRGGDCTFASLLGSHFQVTPSDEDNANLKLGCPEDTCAICATGALPVPITQETCLPIQHPQFGTIFGQAKWSQVNIQNDFIMKVHMGAGNPVVLEDGTVINGDAQDVDIVFVQTADRARASHCALLDSQDITNQANIVRCDFDDVGGAKHTNILRFSSDGAFTEMEVAPGDVVEFELSAGQRIVEADSNCQPMKFPRFDSAGRIGKFGVIIPGGTRKIWFALTCSNLICVPSKCGGLDTGVFTVNPKNNAFSLVLPSGELSYEPRPEGDMEVFGDGLLERATLPWRGHTYHIFHASRHMVDDSLSARAKQAATVGKRDVSDRPSCCNYPEYFFNMETTGVATTFTPGNSEAQWTQKDAAPIQVQTA